VALILESLLIEHSRSRQMTTPLDARRDDCVGWLNGHQE
jgi:hypothetical protein